MYFAVERIGLGRCRTVLRLNVRFELPAPERDVRGASAHSSRAVLLPCPSPLRLRSNQALRVRTGLWRLRAPDGHFCQRPACEGSEERCDPRGKHELQRRRHPHERRTLAMAGPLQLVRSSKDERRAKTRSRGASRLGRSTVGMRRGARSAGAATAGAWGVAENPRHARRRRDPRASVAARSSRAPARGRRGEPAQRWPSPGVSARARDGALRARIRPSPTSSSSVGGRAAGWAQAPG